MKKVLIAGLLLFTLAAMGCASYVPVNVMHPAEVNIAGKKVMVLGDFTGRGGDKMTEELRRLLAGSKGIQLISRNGLYMVLGDLGHRELNPYDPKVRAKLAEMIGAQSILTGRMEQYNYHEEVRVLEVECPKKLVTPSDPNQAPYYVPIADECFESTRTGEAEVAASMTVIDVETGQPFGERVFDADCEDSTEDDSKNPPIIFDYQLLECALEKVAVRIYRAVSPWEETVKVKFYTDGDLPRLETGVKYAKKGLWRAAEDEFQKAVAEARQDPDIKPKDLAKAYWDLGIVYKHTHRFDEAVEQMKNGFDITGDSDYLKEIDRIRRMESDQDRLKKQLGGN